MSCFELNPVKVSVKDLDPFLLQEKDKSVLKAEDTCWHLKALMFLGIWKPMLESKVFVVDSDTIIVGFSDKELLQRGKVGDIMGMKQYLSVMRGWDG